MTGTIATAAAPAAPADARAAARPGGGGRGLVAAWWVALVACGALTLVWLVLGAVVALAADVPAVGAVVADSAAAGGTWSAGILEAGALGEPAGQAVLDYVASAVNLAVAVVLWRRGGRTWTVRLLVLAMIGSAGAFNLQAHAATLVVRRGSGLEIGELHQILLHGIASAAYVGALLLFPAGVVAARGGQRLLVGLAGVALFAAGVGTALLPHTVSCVVFFGFGVP
ncbi:MAG TPA: histidine kinase, partial [Actinomycetospora sp.]|nr:histidine kinase [Actinomycetospora sp.]